MHLVVGPDPPAKIGLFSFVTFVLVSFYQVTGVGLLLYCITYERKCLVHLVLTISKILKPSLRNKTSSSMRPLATELTHFSLTTSDRDPIVQQLKLWKHWHIFENVLDTRPTHLVKLSLPTMGHLEWVLKPGSTEGAYVHIVDSSMRSTTNIQSCQSHTPWYFVLLSTLVEGQQVCWQKDYHLTQVGNYEHVYKRDISLASPSSHHQ